MNGNDIIKVIVILTLFGLLYLVNILSVGIKRIKDNWILYKCNPIVMPFASVFGQDPVSNFAGCIQNMQALNMDYLLQPIKNNINLLSQAGGSFNMNLSNVRGYLNILKEKILGVVDYIYSLFTGIITEFQKIIITVKDIVAKLAGTLITILYTLETAVITTESFAIKFAALARTLGIND